MKKHEIISEASIAITTVLDVTAIAMRGMGAEGNLTCYDEIYAKGMKTLAPIVKLAQKGAEYELLPKDDKDVIITQLREGLDRIEDTIKYYLEHDQELLATITKLKQETTPSSEI